MVKKVIPMGGAVLARAGYLVSDTVLANLARDYVDGVARTDSIRGGYLRILVAHSKRAFRSVKDAIQAVEQTHQHLYGVISEAVLTKDIAAEEGLSKEEAARRARERNRRTNFARTAKSALMGFLKRGGKLQTLKPHAVTKDALRLRLTQSRAGPTTRKSTWNRLEDRLEGFLKRVAAKDPDAAQEMLVELQGRLAAVVATKPVATGRRKVGELTLHPH